MIEVNDTIVVGQFFWASEDNCLGFKPYAKHGHGLSFGGSVYEYDRLVVLGFEGDMAVVVVHKDEVPYGAPCPHGMVFMVTTKFLESQENLVSNLKDNEEKKKKLANKYV